MIQIATFCYNIVSEKQEQGNRKQISVYTQLRLFTTAFLKQTELQQFITGI